MNYRGYEDSLGGRRGHADAVSWLPTRYALRAECQTRATVSPRATYVMRRSHSSQMFCPGGRPPVLLTGASGRVTGACTWRRPAAVGGGGAAPGLTSTMPITILR